MVNIKSNFRKQKTKSKHRCGVVGNENFRSLRRDKMILINKIIRRKKTGHDSSFEMSKF